MTPALWTSRRFRAAFLQILTLVIVAVVAFTIGHNTYQNMKSLGIASGFGFLREEAGFAIQMSLVAYSETASYGRAFLVGLLNTVLVASLGIVTCTVLGFIVGIARLSPNWLVARLAAFYVEAARNVPLLLQIFLWYFGVLAAMPHPRESLSLFETVFLNNRGLYLPRARLEPEFWLIPAAFVLAVPAVLALRHWARRRQEATGRRFPAGWGTLALFLGFPGAATLGVWSLGDQAIAWSLPQLEGFNFSGGLVLIPELIALWLALSTYTAAFVAEIIRGGILSVGKGQSEAAHALGLSRRHTLRLVVVPQAMRVIVPPLTNQHLSLIKNSSLAAAIGYPELVSVFAGTVLNQTGQAIEVITITMGVYLTISLAVSVFMNWYNRRISLAER